eukprot:scaffold7671_cov104-Isochrysis_galbana.AAC.2
MQLEPRMREDCEAATAIKMISPASVTSMKFSSSIPQATGSFGSILPRNGQLARNTVERHSGLDGSARAKPAMQLLTSSVSAGAAEWPDAPAFTPRPHPPPPPGALSAGAAAVRDHQPAGVHRPAAPDHCSLIICHSACRLRRLPVWNGDRR